MSLASQRIDTAKLDEIMQKFGYEKSNLIAMLQHVQQIYRYLPEDAITYIGSKVEGLSPATVFGVATFYAQFSLEPKGKYEIKVCDGTACHVRGSSVVLEAIKNKLFLEKGKFTTPDGLFSLEIVSCLGACGLAPVFTVNGEVYGKATVKIMDEIIDKIVEFNDLITCDSISEDTIITDIHYTASDVCDILSITLEM